MELSDLMKNSHKSEYLGHTRYDFMIGENDCSVVEPNSPVEGKKWVWKTMFFQAFPNFDKAMLDRGWWVAQMNVGNTFGCPDAMRRFDVFYKEMTEKYGFDPKPVLEGMSRGGLYAYNWAVKNTDKVGMVFGDNPVCDFKSWPMGKGTGPGSQEDTKQLLQCYHFSSEEEALAWPNNPVDSIEPLVKAGVPLVHIYGDADEIVPWDENTGIMAERVKALGSELSLFVKPGGKHHPHGPESPNKFAEWVINKVG